MYQPATSSDPYRHAHPDPATRDAFPIGQRNHADFGSEPIPALTASRAPGTWAARTHLRTHRPDLIEGPGGTVIIYKLWLLVGVVAAVLLAGCSDGIHPGADSIGESALSGTPTIDADNPARVGDALPHHGAPSVKRPLADTTRWEAKPCDLLPKRQLASADFDPMRMSPNDNGGPGCTYDQMSIITVTTTIGTRLPDGLSGLYAERTSFKLFTPVDDLKGHPAVVADLTDRRRYGSCAIVVGLSDDLAYRTIVDADPKTRQGRNPCKFAADLTVLALHTMHNNA